MKDFPSAQLDELPFGVIKVDKSGKILIYNAAEAELAGASRRRVIGKNFFTDVAPCTNVEAFATKFHKGIEAGGLNVVFPFVFTFPKGPMNVWVTLFYDGGGRRRVDLRGEERGEAELGELVLVFVLGAWRSARTLVTGHPLWTSDFGLPSLS